MLEHFSLWQRVILFVALALWAVASTISVALGYAHLFGAPGVADPTPLPKLKDQISENFDDLLAAKAEEKTMETYRYELFFSVVGTLQRGFGEMTIGLIRGI